MPWNSINLYSKIFGWWRNFGSILFVLQNSWHFVRWRNFGSILFVLQNSWCFVRWKNFGSISFVRQNSWHFQKVEEFWIYFISTEKFLSFTDNGGIWDLFYLYWNFFDIFVQWRNFGSILFVLQKFLMIYKHLMYPALCHLYFRLWSGKCWKCVSFFETLQVLSCWNWNYKHYANKAIIKQLKIN